MKRYYTDAISRIIALLIITAWALFLTIIMLDIISVYAM